METKFSSSNSPEYILVEGFQMKYFLCDTWSKHASTLEGERDSLLLDDWLPHPFLQYLTLAFGIETLLLVKHNQSLLVSPIFGKPPKEKVKRCSTTHHIP
ncbi:hypothetical protein ERO13_D11G325850v2 [Gossypium hirsutum]|uniref:Uncharacterized protein n=1 Tax=Gossypium barbadense TaxID=3634 RepID=A0A5J5PJS1_GOSBA|nr:hypothetical protein ES319_D11G363800v1 [Gossypium barbadense]KAG4123427.1 hypothetical protein ERO13_D11G325850v2 [Gossypium hirsutum]